MRKRLTGIFLAALFAVGISGCGNTALEDDSENVFIIEDKSAHIVSAHEESQEEVQSASNGSIPDFGVWYPYWDYDTATEELDNYGSKANTICFFAAYYDVNNKAFVPENTKSTFTQLNRSGILGGKNTYLTFVNDKLLNQGSSLKDTALLYELIGDSKKAAAHADEIIALTHDLGCQGIEIDYEAIKKDNTLWGLFNSFVNILSEKASAQGMPLRIVFEPSAPVAEFNWPSYPEYVMMCYNLHGYGTTPGPKADNEWLKSLCEKMSRLPGNVNMAFANGGFDFSASGDVRQINYRDAVNLLTSHSATAKRDSSSAAMYFTYTDESGTGHEVWYADEETISAWIGIAESCGINRVSVWRLGGNI